MSGLLHRRLIAACFLHAFFSLAFEIDVLVGDDGLWPAALVEQRLRADFDAPARWLYFPSGFYLVGCSTATLQGAAISGAVTSALAIYRPSAPLFGLMWALYMSFSVADGLVLWAPWDCMLLEAGMLCAIGADAGFGMRWLAFRVLFGFGKTKFVGSSLTDADTYLRRFLLMQPLPTVAAWLLHEIEALWVWRLGYALLFSCEMVAPFCLLLLPDGRARRVAARGVIILMVGISCFGCYAWFNVLTAACVLPCALPSTAHRPSRLRHDACSAFGRLLLRLIVGAWVAVSAPFLITSQWSSPGMLWWDFGVAAAREVRILRRHGLRPPRPSLVPLRAWGVRVILRTLQIVSSWRLAHSYGVFPPSLSPTMNVFATWEVSADGTTWHSVGHHTRHATPDERPPLPGRHSFLGLFSRLDYGAYYDGLDMLFEPATDITPSPYLKAAFSNRHRLAWALLSRSPSLAKHVLLPPNVTITHVRAILVSVVPASMARTDFEAIRPLGERGCTFYTFDGAPQQPQPPSEERPQQQPQQHPQQQPQQRQQEDREHQHQQQPPPPPPQCAAEGVVSDVEGLRPLGRWSRLLGRCVHLPTTTLDELRRRFGDEPHAASLPRPDAFSPTNWAQALLSSARTRDEPMAQMPADEWSYPVGVGRYIGHPFSCLMAMQHAPFVPAWMRSSSVCRWDFVPRLSRSTNRVGDQRG